MNKSVSVIIPAYNEEKNLALAVDSVLAGLAKNGIADYEILIFNDASTDNTGIIADELAQKYPMVRVIHNPRNMNKGYSIIKGFQLANKEYVGVVDGDNGVDLGVLDLISQELGKADIVVPYIQNPESRPLGRRFLSSAYVFIINTAFGLNMRYYNGFCYFKTRMVQEVPISTYGFAYMTEILVKLLKSGATYVEVPMVNRAYERGATKAFRFKNVVSVFKTFLTLFWDVQVLRRRISLRG